MSSNNEPATIRIAWPAPYLVVKFLEPDEHDEENPAREPSSYHAENARRAYHVAGHGFDFILERRVPRAPGQEDDYVSISREELLSRFESCATCKNTGWETIAPGTQRACDCTRKDSKP